MTGRAAPRHQAPSRRDDGSEVLTVARLLTRERYAYEPLRHQLLRPRPDRVIDPRHITVLPRAPRE